MANLFTAAPGRYQHTSYYSDNRPSRPQSAAFRGDNLYDQQNQARWGPPADRRRFPPQEQYPQRVPGGNPYPSANAPIDHRSYETVGASSGSSGERQGYMTDPTSSEDSSVERRQSPPKRQPEPVNDYGIGFNQNSEYQPSSFSVGAPGGGLPYGAGPPVPNKAGVIPRKPTQVQRLVEEEPKKRRSWLPFGSKRN